MVHSVGVHKVTVIMVSPSQRGEGQSEKEGGNQEKLILRLSGSTVPNGHNHSVIHAALELGTGIVQRGPPKVGLREVVDFP